MRFSLSLSKKQCWWIDHTRRLIANLSLAKWKYRHASKAEPYVWGTQFWKIGCLVWLIYKLEGWGYIWNTHRIKKMTAASVTRLLPNKQFKETFEKLLMWKAVTVVRNTNTYIHWTMGNGSAKYGFGLIARQLSANYLVQTPSADVNDKWTKLLKIPRIHSFDSDDGMMRIMLRGELGQDRW